MGRFFSSEKARSAWSRARLALRRSAGASWAAGPKLARLHAVRAWINSTGGAVAHPAATATTTARTAMTTRMALYFLASRFNFVTLSIAAWAAAFWSSP